MTDADGSQTNGRRLQSIENRLGRIEDSLEKVREWQAGHNEVTARQETLCRVHSERAVEDRRLMDKIQLALNGLREDSARSKAKLAAIVGVAMVLAGFAGNVLAHLLK